jgi:hypothetical protein
VDLNADRQQTVSNLLREPTAGRTQSHFAGLGQPPPRAQSIVPGTKGLFSGGRKRAKLPVGGVQGLYSWSILAAKMKSLSVRPLILCVQVVDGS